MIKQTNIRMSEEFIAEISLAQVEHQKKTDIEITNAEFIRHLIRIGLRQLRHSN